MRNDFESNYLAHHGILGQKWGKKNGPPYPLDAKDHSSSEKKAGWRESLKEKKQAKNRQGKNYEKDTEEFKRAKLRAGKNIINRRAGDEFDDSYKDQKIVEKYLKKYGGDSYDENKLVKEYDQHMEAIFKKYGAGAIPKDQKEIDSTASRTKTWIGDADTTFKFLAKNCYEDLTRYGQQDNAKNYNAKELIKTFHDAFGDDNNAQRSALKLLYSSECTRYMDEESSDPEYTQVFRKQKSLDNYGRSNRNSNLSVGDSWASEHVDEWKGYMEQNVGHSIKALTGEEKAASLKESGLYYDSEDLEYIKKLK